MSSRGFFKIHCLAHLGADPEVRYTANGAAVTTIRVAASESWKDKQTGQQHERTEWQRIKFFGRLAEIAGEYLRKGQQVYIEGTLRTDKYTDKEGIERFTTEIIANEMQMLGGGREDGDRSNRDGGERGRSSGAANNSSRSNGSSNPGGSDGQGGGQRPAQQQAAQSNFDDDPF